MATLKIVVLKHQEKEDGTWNVKIRLTHDRKSVYISTSYFVTKGQLAKDYTIKDKTTYDLVYNYMRKLRKLLDLLGEKEYLYSAKELADYLENESKPTNIDFVEYMHLVIDKMKQAQRKSVKNYIATLNRLVDFDGSKIAFSSINVK